MTEQPSEPVAAHLEPDPDALSTTWRGHVVRVQAKLIPRYLYSSADITVEIDNEIVLHTGGQKKATGIVAETFVRAGVRHSVDLAWGLGSSARGFPVTVRVDGETILDAVPVPLANPSMSAVAVGGFVVVAMVLMAVIGLISSLSR